MLKGDMLEAVIASIRHVANGVRVIDVNVAAMELITIIGPANECCKPGKTLLSPCNKECETPAPFDSNGKITPPGNLAADANAIAKNFAVPICIAANHDAKGAFGFTLAHCIIAAGSPWDVATKGVHCPSTMH
jgi:hypothetical protein